MYCRYGDIDCFIRGLGKYPAVRRVVEEYIRSWVMSGLGTHPDLPYFIEPVDGRYPVVIGLRDGFVIDENRGVGVVEHDAIRWMIGRDEIDVTMWPRPLARWKNVSTPLDPDKVPSIVLRRGNIHELVYMIIERIDDDLVDYVETGRNRVVVGRGLVESVLEFTDGSAMIESWIRSSIIIGDEEFQLMEGTVFINDPGRTVGELIDYITRVVSEPIVLQKELEEVFRLYTDSGYTPDDVLRLSVFPVRFRKKITVSPGKRFHPYMRIPFLLLRYGGIDVTVNSDSVSVTATVPIDSPITEKRNLLRRLIDAETFIDKILDNIDRVVDEYESPIYDYILYKLSTKGIMTWKQVSTVHGYYPDDKVSKFIDESIIIPEEMKPIIKQILWND